MPDKSSENQSADENGVNVGAEAKSMYELLTASAENNRSTQALIFSKRRYTYDTVLKMVDSMSETLRATYSIAKGTRIGILLPNCPQFAVTIFSASKIGAISVPINPRSSRREIETIVKHSGMKCLVTASYLLPSVRHLAESGLLIVVTRMEDFISLGSAMRTAIRHGLHYIEQDQIGERIVKFSDLVYTPDVGPSESYFPDDVSMLAYSGSTSASPKAAAITVGNLYSNVMAMGLWFPKIERRTVTIAAVPFSHVFSLVLALLVPISLGSTSVLIDDYRQVEEMLSSIKEYIGDYFVGNPSIFRSIIEKKELLKFRLGMVKVFISGGDTITEEFAKRFEEVTGSSIVTTYGTRELTGVSHINPLDKRKRKYGSIGTPLDGTEAKIVNEETGDDAGDGETGILAIKGPQVMKEYWDNKSATGEAFKENWFLTGDTARIDKDGFFFLYERRKEAIVSDSAMVSATEIEEVIMQNDKVKEVAVIGLPDPRRGEIIKAFIAAKEGKKLTEKELRELCQEQLSEYKRPSIYEFRDELPKNMDGQVIKRILKEEESREKQQGQ